jgi:hypothetical protein
MFCSVMQFLHNMRLVIRTHLMLVRVLQDCHKGVTSVLKGVTRMLQGCCKDVAR